MIRFRYKPELGRRGQKIWRPVADVWFLATNGKWIELHPYIDSGADVTLVPFSLGHLLGLKKGNSSVERIGGIGGSIGIVYKSCRIKIGEKELGINVAWAQTEDIPPLLGREDIFDEFEISFRQKQREIIFQ